MLFAKTENDSRCLMYFIEKYGIDNEKPNELKRKQESEKKKNLYKYTKRGEWRSVRRRLRSFIRFVDFLVMELLKRIVTLAVSDTVTQIESAMNMNEKPKQRAIDWSEMKRNANKSVGEFLKEEPRIVSSMFEVNLVLEQRKSSAKRKSAKLIGMMS